MNNYLDISIPIITTDLLDNTMSKGNCKDQNISFLKEKS